MEDKNLIEEMVKKMDDTDKLIFSVVALAILRPEFAEKLKEKAEKLKKTE